LTFDNSFRDQPVTAVAAETRDASWREYLPGMAKMLGLTICGLVLDAVMEGLTGTKTDFATMAHVGGTAWYIFGPGAPEPKRNDTVTHAARTGHPTL
jgi:hypothetical protein